MGLQRGTEVEATLAASEALRDEASAMIVAQLKGKGAGLRPSLTLRQATDVFFVLTRAELYHDLTVGRGWSPARARRWLCDILAHQLLSEP